jgi:hypothetical protein
MEQINYTTINHIARERFGLSLEEYCVADLVHNLSHNPKNTIPGWCHAAKPTLGTMLGISRPSIFRHIKKLLSLKLLEQNPDQRELLRSTSKWYDNVIITTEQPKNNTPSQIETTSIKSIPLSSQNETMPPSQIETLQGYNTNKDNTKRERSLSFLLNIPEDTRLSFSTKFKVTEAQLIDKAEDLYHWCVSKGKRYSNYESFLRNAIKKDFGTRPNQKVDYEPVEEIPMTPEQQAMAQAKLAELRSKAKSIGSFPS